jgi:hypothetical protein
MDPSTLDRLADIICGDDATKFPIYRSSSYLTSFFDRAGVSRFVHDGSTRKKWAVESLRACNRNELSSVIKRLVSPREYRGDKAKVAMALAAVNEALSLEGVEVRLNGIDPYYEKVKVNFDPAKPEPELKSLPRPNFLLLGLEPGIGELLGTRWDEAQRCVDAKAYLAANIIMGSLLEGLLLGAFQRFPREANTSSSAPRDAAGRVHKLHDWSLSQMIDVAHQIGWLGLDVKKFSHALRDFRNLIHPYEHLLSKTIPDADTCGISWLVVQAAVNDLAKKLRGG